MCECLSIETCISKLTALPGKGEERAVSLKREGEWEGTFHLTFNLAES